MKLIVNGKAYELDRAVIEKTLIETVKSKIGAIEKDAPMQISFMARSAISGVMAYLGRKHEELRKPDDMDVIEHAAHAVANMVLTEWEKHPLEVTASESNTNQSS